MRLLAVFVGLALNIFAAGPVVLGVRGGVPFSTDPLGLGSVPFTSTTGFEVGPTAGVRLPLGFSIEGDALYHRDTLRLDVLSGLTPNLSSDSWQFPVMLKFTGGNQAIAPVLGAGLNFRHVNNGNLVNNLLFNQTFDSNSVGFVAGGGLQFRAGAANIVPEIRYTRWANPFSQPLLNLLPFGQNQVSVLVGVTF
jgi:hypothetical protein